MHNLIFTFPRIVIAMLVVALSVGCSKEAKKARLLDRADRYFKAGEYEKAKIEYLNVMSVAGMDPVALQRLGAIWLEQGSALQAIPFLQEVAKQNPGDIENRKKLGNLYAAGGAFEEARVEALAILAASPGDEEGLLLLAQICRTPVEITDVEQRIASSTKTDSAMISLARAQLAGRRGDTAATEAAVAQALKADPTLATAHAAAAIAAWRKNDLKAADTEFREMMRLLPVRSGGRIQFAQFKIETNDLPAAKQILEETTAAAPDYLPAWQSRAQIAFLEGKYDETLSLLDSIFKVDAVNLNAGMLRSQVLLAKGDAEGSVKALQAMVQIYPGFPPLKFQLARAQLQNKQISEATGTLKDVVAASPEYVEAVLLLADVNTRSGEGGAAVEAMQQLVKQRPNFPAAQVRLAAAYESLGRLDEAAAVLSEYAEDSPKLPQPHLLLGTLLVRQGKLPEARAAFEKAMALAPKAPLIVSQLIDLDLREGNLDGALKRATDLRKSEPGMAAAYLFEGKVLAAKKDWTAAEGALKRAIELDPNSTGAYELLVAIYVSQNNLRPALSQLENLLQKRPDSARDLLLSALIKEKLLEYAGARDAYEKLLKVQPELATALNNLAYLYSEQLGDPGKGREYASKARALKPADPAISDTLGWILYQQGEYPQAATLLQESAAKLPENSEVQYHLGMALYMMGKRDEARAALNRSMSLPGEFARKKEAASQLAVLEGNQPAESTASTADLAAIVQKQPDDLLARVRLAEAYEKAGETDKAAAAYEEVARKNPEILPAVSGLARTSLAKGNRDQALKWARKARDLAPEDPAVTALVAQIAVKGGNSLWAYGLLQEAARKSPARPDLQLQLGQAAYAVGKTDEARRVLDQLKASAPTSTEAQDADTFLKMMVIAASPNEAGEVGIQEMLKADPENLPALMALATLQNRQGRAQEAIDTYSRLLKRHSDFAPAQRDLADLLAKDNNRLPKAFDLAMRARKALPEDPVLATVLAKIVYKKGDYSYAVQLLKESAAKQPPKPEDLFYLGMAQAKLGKDADSRSALEQALKEGLPEPLATEAREAVSGER